MPTKTRLTDKDRTLLDRLLSLEIECCRQTHSLHEWARLIARGRADAQAVEVLERGGMRIERRGKQCLLKLSNPNLEAKEWPVYRNSHNSHRLPLNTLLRRAGGWACGTVRFGDKPQRATAISLYTLARVQKRYNPQVSL